MASTRTRTIRLRLYPTPSQAAKFAENMDWACDLYNALLQQRRDAFEAKEQEVGRRRPWHPLDGDKRPGAVRQWDTDTQKYEKIPVSEIGIDMKSQSRALTEYKQTGGYYPEGLAALVAVDVVRRLDKAYRAYFSGVKAGRRSGPPRYRSKIRFDSLTYQLTCPSREKFDEDGKSLGRGTTSGAGMLRDDVLYLTGIGAFPLLRNARRRKGPGSVAATNNRAQGQHRNGLRLHRDIPEDAIPRIVTVTRSCGRWYACIALELPAVEPNWMAGPTGPARPSVGIDLGVKTFATLYSNSQPAIAATAEDLERQNPKIAHGGDENSLRIDGARASDRYARRVRRTQRTVARRTRRGHSHSHRRRKAVALYARAKEVERLARADHRHKVTKVIARNFGRIAMEKLDVQEMVRAPKNDPDWGDKPARLKEDLDRRILDGAMYQFRLVQTYKAEDAGGIGVAVSAVNSTRECSECGELVPMPPLLRWFVCPSCGNKQPRTRNSAKNVLQRMERPDGAHPSGHNGFGRGLRTSPSPRWPINDDGKRGGG